MNDLWHVYYQDRDLHKGWIVKAKDAATAIEMIDHRTDPFCMDKLVSNPVVFSHTHIAELGY